MCGIHSSDVLSPGFRALRFGLYRVGAIYSILYSIYHILLYYILYTIYYTIYYILYYRRGLTNEFVVLRVQGGSAFCWGGGGGGGVTLSVVPVFRPSLQPKP